MISSLTITNFLSHKETQLDFSKGVNVIVGPTDSGKSAIIKALKWAIFNRPMGDGMRSSWGGLTVVGMVVDEKMVIRQKFEGLNQYIIADQEFNAIKGDVPEQVSRLLNLSDINLQTQFDSHFLLSKSPGEVAVIFNKVAHLDRIDVGLQNIQRWTRDIQKKLEFNKESLGSNKERLLAYDSLPEIEGLLITLEEKETIRQRQANKRQEVLKLITSIKSVEEELEEMEFIVGLEEEVVNILAIIQQRKDVTRTLVGLNMVLTTLYDIDDELKEIQAITSLEKIVQTTLDLSRQQLGLDGERKALKTLIGKIWYIEDELAEVGKELETMEKQFHKELGKGNVCPLCEQVIK